jgi:hypothetical protein
MTPARENQQTSQGIQKFTSWKKESARSEYSTNTSWSTLFDQGKTTNTWKSSELRKQI